MIAFLNRPVAHWWAQRLTALLMIPFIIWAVIGLYQTKGQAAEIVLWLKKPLVTSIFISLSSFVLYHAQLGITVIIEDYIAHPGGQKILILCNKFAMTAGIILIFMGFYALHWGS